MHARKLLAALLAAVLLLGLLPSDTLAAHEHVLNWNWTDPMQDPTCTSPGKTWVNCDDPDCPTGGVEMDYPPALGHSWGAWTTVKAATCTAGGTEKRTCSRCGETETRSTAALGHSWGSWITVKAATCTSGGTEQHSCSRCGETETRDTAATGHSWSAWTVIQEPGEYTMGIRERKCKNCGEVEWAYFYPDGTLRRGDSGEAVTHLQEMLNEAGYDCGTPDGSYGPNTESAVNDFEKDMGLTGDGVAWPGVIAALEGKQSGGGSAPQGSISAVIVSNTPYTGTVGEVVEVQISITNTGNTPIAQNLFGALYADDTTANDSTVESSYAYQNVDLYNASGEKTGNTGYIQPGETVPGTITITVTGGDVAHGSLYRFVSVSAYILVEQEYGWIVLRDADGSPIVIEDTVIVDLLPGEGQPDKGGGTVVDYSLEVDYVSSTAYTGTVGETVEVDVTLRNTGSTRLSVNSYSSYDLDGNFMEEDSFFCSMTEEEKVHLPSGVEVWTGYIEPGTSIPGTFTLQVTQEDVDRGYLYRELACNGYITVTDEEGLLAYLWNSESDSPEITRGWVYLRIQPEQAQPANASLSLDGATEEYKGSYSVGDPFGFTLDLTNTGDEAVDTIVFTFSRYNSAGELVEYGKNVIAPEEQLPPGEHYYVSATYTALEDDSYIGWATVVCVATAVSVETGEPVVSNTWDFEFNVLPRDTDGTPNLVLAVTQISPAKTTYVNGEVVSFTWTLANVGDAPCWFGGIDRYTDSAANTTETFIPWDPSRLLASYGGSISGEGSITLDASMAEGNIVYAIFEAEGVEYDTEHNTYVVTCISNQVPFQFLLGDQPPWEPVPDTDFRSVRVEKSVLSSPADGHAYHEGENILYQVVVTNTAPFPIYDVEVCDSLKGANEDAVLDILPVLGIAESYTYTFTYQVKPEDVPGFITNQATASWPDPATEQMVTAYSNIVVVPTGEDEPVPTITKALVSPFTHTDDQGGYFVPGDTLEYTITVDNPTDELFHTIYICDSLEPTYDQVIVLYKMLPAMSTIVETYCYVINEADVGKVTNYAYCFYTDDDGPEHLIVSNDVTVDVRSGGTDDLIPPVTWEPTTSLAVSKAEASTPANGLFYTLGETIDYTIFVTNNGETVITDIIVMDSLGGVHGCEIGSILKLEPHESRTFSFSYTVKESDVAAGYVINYASAVFPDDGTYRLVEAEPVISDTDGIPDTIPDGPGKLLTPVKLPNEGEGYTPCVRTLTGKGLGTAEYTLHSCSLHKPVAQLVDALVSASTTEADRVAAWRQARELWQAEADALYSALYDAASGNAKATVLNERAMFYAQLEIAGTALTALYPDDPAVVEMKLAEAMMNKVADLCYEAHTTPEARADSLLGSWKELPEAEAGTACERIVLDETVGDVAYSVELCGSHSATDSMALGLIRRAAATEDAETGVRLAAKLWLVELDAVSNALYRAVPAESRAAITADRVTFDNWLAARVKLLELLYPEGTGAAEGELYAIMDKVIDGCNAVHK